MKDIKDIVKKYLEETGFDGLVCSEIPCGCLLDEDLFDCGECFGDCTPGHKHVVDPKANDGAKWLVFPGKCGPYCGGIVPRTPDGIIGEHDFVGLRRLQEARRLLFSRTNNPLRE